MRDFKVGKEAQLKLKESLNLIAEAVGSTLGPGGMPFGYDKMTAEQRLMSTFSKDGLTVLRALSFPQDPAAQAVLEYCRQASSHSFLASGDGTSSTIVLANAVANAVFEENCKYPQYLARILEKDADVAIETIKKEAIKGDSTVRKVAITSCNGDEELADVVVESVKLSSAFGSILVEKRAQSDIRYEISKQDGYSNCYGYNYNTTLAVSASESAAGSKAIEWENPYTVAFNGHLLALDQLKPILLAWELSCKDAPSNLIIFTYEVSDEITNKLLVINRTLAGSKLAAFVVKIKLTGEMLSGPNILRDIAAYSGIIDDKIVDGGNYKSFDSSFFGTCGKVVISPNHTAVFGRSDNHWVDKRILQNQSIVDNARSDYDREITRIRNAELAEGLVLVKIGGGTPPDLNERADRFDDGSKAAQSCMRAGALPGSGCSYIRAAITSGVHPTLQKAFRSIHERVMINFGVDPINGYIPPKGYATKIDDLHVTIGPAEELDILDACETVCAVIKNGVALGVKIATLGGYSYRGKDQDGEF